MTVKKLWLDDSTNIRPGTINVQLYRNGTAYGVPVVLNGDNNWEHEFTGLDAQYDWSVDEVGVPNGYTKSISHSETVWTITNRYQIIVPDTGDHTLSWPWICLLAVSAGGLFLLLLKKKK